MDLDSLSKRTERDTMLYDFLCYTGKINSAQIEETFVSARVCIGTDNGNNSFVQKFFDELKTISPRDTFEFYLDISGDIASITDCTFESLKRIQKHLSDNEDGENIEIELKISKKVKESKCSIYFFNCFTDYLNTESILNATITLSSLIDNRIDFEVFSTIDPLGSKTINFYPYGSGDKCMVLNSEINRLEKLDLLYDNSISPVANSRLIPDDFYLLSNSDYENLVLFFQKACTVYALSFLANSFELKNDGTISYKIHGYKTVSCENDQIKDIIESCKVLYKIYSWAYEGGNSSDKIGLARNVLSLHLDDTGRIKLDKEVWEAIQSNYQIYLKSNIQSYLEVKNKIGEFVIESTSKTYEIADQLLDTVKNNAFIILTYLLTVVVVNGLKDSGVTNIFSDTYLAIVLILTIVSGLWLLMSIFESYKRFDSASNTIIDILKINYNKILMESEIEGSVHPVIEKNRKYLRGQIKRYSLWWIVILIIFSLSYFTANRYFSTDRESSNVNHSISKSKVRSSPSNVNELNQANSAYEKSRAAD